MPPAWIADLRAVLGEAVVDDPDVMEGYAVDWTGRYRGRPGAVVRARRTDDVVALMELSARIGFGVVPQGGNTGLVAGTTAPEGTVLLNLAGLDTLTEGEMPVAGAGVTIAAVQDTAARQGRRFGVDLGSRHSATVGGTLATNAAGLFACRFGRMKDQVTGVEAVLSDGTVLEGLDRIAPAGAGTDPVDLLGGSEGTLAVVTAARLRLHAPLGSTVVVLSGFDTLSETLAFLADSPPPVGAEVFGHPELQVVIDHTGLPAPLPDHPWYLLVEVEERHAADLAVPPTAVVGRDLWRYRDRITESLATLGVIHKFDVVLPPGRLEALVADLTPELAPHRLFAMGHVLMADFHLNVAPAQPTARVPDRVDEVVYAAVEEAGGEPAGEHGVGRAKAERARAALSPGRRWVADRLKRAFDPEGRLNPGAGTGRV